jgi:glycosyltransferase involved in cell wall biosynthesis
VPNSLLRVCLVSPLPPPYGGISHWTAMVSRYAGMRKSVRLRVVNTAPGWRPIHEVRVWKRIVGGTLQALGDLLRFFRILSAWHPNVVHLTTSGHLAVFRDLGILLIARIFSVPVVYHIRFGRVPQMARERSKEWQIISFAMRLAHTVVCIDCITEEALRRHLPDINLARIPNCISWREFPQHLAAASSQHIAVFLGWVIPSKGIGDLLDAWMRLEPGDWRLHVIGPGGQDYRKKLMDLYQLERVNFIGELSHNEAMERLAEAEVLVLPSYSEGFPNVVLEAMVLGKAIVATAVGAIPEMLADGCGTLVEPGDAKKLAVALQLILGDAELRSTMGERARNRAILKFSIDAVFEQYLSVWHQAAGKG